MPLERGLPTHSEVYVKSDNTKLFPQFVLSKQNVCQFVWILHSY